jgi:hypothetical protein
MKGRIVAAALAMSVLLNVVVIPLLVWWLAGYSMIYRRNVDYVAELAYAVGYHKALGNNLATELASYPSRLQITKADPDRVEAIIWPAKGQVLVLQFSDPKICNATIGEPDGAASESQPIRSVTNSTPSAAGSSR